MVGAADCRSAGPWFNFRVEVMVYLRDRIRQTDESDHSDVQQYEPNQNSNHNDYKKVSEQVEKSTKSKWRKNLSSHPPRTFFFLKKNNKIKKRKEKC